MQEHNAGRSSRSDEPADRVERGTAGPSPALVALLVVLALAVIFVVTNRTKVELHFLFWSPQAHVWTALVTATVIGIILDRVFLAWWHRRRRGAKGE